MAKEIGGALSGGALGGLAALLAIPGVGIVLLIIGIVFIAIFLGAAVGVYLMLQAYHLWTACVFTVVAVFLFYIGIKTKIINDSAIQKFPWLPLLIPAAFLFGYLGDITGSINFTVAPMALSSAQQGSANAIIIFLLIACILYVVTETLFKTSPEKKRRRK